MFFVIELIAAVFGVGAILFSKISEAGTGFIEKRIYEAKKYRFSVIEDPIRERELYNMPLIKKIELAKSELEPIFGSEWKTNMIALNNTNVKSAWLDALLLAMDGKVSWNRTGSGNPYYVGFDYYFPTYVIDLSGRKKTSESMRTICFKMAKRIEEILNSKKLRDAYGNIIDFKFVLVEESCNLIANPHLWFTFDNPLHGIRKW